MENAQSYDEWMQIARREEEAAFALAQAGHNNAALHHIGTATECCLKAVIMKRERLNRWPDKSDRRDIYTHSLTDLARIAGIEFTAGMGVAPAWHVVSGWKRLSSYDPSEMPRRVLDGWLNAAFGEMGVVTWLKTI